MPHLTVEYSANVADHHDVDLLIEAVHQAAIDFEIGPLAGMRTRGAERSMFRVADGGDDLAFVAITARLGPGRDAATKQAFIEHVLDRAQRQIKAEDQIKAEGHPLAIAWSMEVQEIDADFRVNRNEVAKRLAGDQRTDKSS